MEFAREAAWLAHPPGVMKNVPGIRIVRSNIEDVRIGFRG